VLSKRPQENRELRPQYSIFTSLSTIQRIGDPSFVLMVGQIRLPHFTEMETGPENLCFIEGIEGALSKTCLPPFPHY
jgi:hypothetical protein